MVKSKDTVTQTNRTDMIQGQYTVLKDNVRLMIFSFLSFYSKLSFQQIVALTDKSKSTISHHLKKLQEVDIIEEVDVAEKDHGREKYYALKTSTNAQIPEDGKLTPDQILDLFSYGRYYFMFVNSILKHNINTVETVLESQEQDVDQITSIIQSTKFISLPLPNNKYNELMGKMHDTVAQFMLENQGLNEYDENNDLNWVLALGIPYDKIKNLTKSLD